MEKAPMDWQILQQENGFATVHLAGSWNAPQAALDIGVKAVRPVVRVVEEENNYQRIPWTEVRSRMTDRTLWKGVWEVELRIPTGGPYRIEGGLDTHSVTGLRWMFRGDARRHVGVGDLFVMAGQSNSSGFAKDMAYDPPQMGVHLFRNCSRWDIAAHPVNEATGAGDVENLEMGNPGVSPYLSFGKHYSRLTGRPVGLIATAQGGQPLSRWDKREDGALFDRMIQQIHDCGGKVAGILWYQGCSDTQKERAACYLEKFRRVVEDTRQALGNQVPFFTFQINRSLEDNGGNGWALVREAQRRAAREISGVTVLSTLHCGLSDSIHNDAVSNVMLGEKMARHCAGILCGGQPFFAPDIESAVWKDNELVLSFSNVADELELSRLPADRCGFLVEDGKTPVPVTAWRTEKNKIILTLEHTLKKGCTVSYAWEVNPVSQPVMDLVTYLPLLSFYRFPVQIG